jgi:hypothetical protein
MNVFSKYVSAAARFDGRLQRRESKHLALAGPFGRQVGETGNSQPKLNRSKSAALPPPYSGLLIKADGEEVWKPFIQR